MGYSKTSEDSGDCCRSICALNKWGPKANRKWIEDMKMLQKKLKLYFKHTESLYDIMVPIIQKKRDEPSLNEDEMEEIISSMCSIATAFQTARRWKLNTLQRDERFLYFLNLTTVEPKRERDSVEKAAIEIEKIEKTYHSQLEGLLKEKFSFHDGSPKSDILADVEKLQADLNHKLLRLGMEME